MRKLLLLTVFTAVLISCKNEKKSEISENQNIETYEKIAMANGLEEFDSISKLKFTFNVKVNDSLRSSRRWVWDTKTNKISLTEKDSVMSYTKKDSIAEDKKMIDRKFVNDSYWLLFPYQLKWSNANFSEVKTAEAPISGKEMKMLTVSYPSEGGYTPGDSYDIYFNDDYMIQEWVYKPSGGGGNMATTWEDYRDFDGVKIARSHKSKDGTFELFFSDISLEE